MRKIIRQVGTSVGIIFNKEEQEILQIKVGDVIEFEIKKGGEKKK